jgi:hypothetical protein
MGSCCWQSSMRPNLSQYYTAHRWAVLVLYCSSLSSCYFHFWGVTWKRVWWLHDLRFFRHVTRMYHTFWDHTRSFLRHHCRLEWSLYCSSLSSCDLNVVLYLYSGKFATSTLLWDYAAMKAVWDHTRSFLRHHADFDCGITADWIRRLVGRIAASLPSWFVVL